MLFLFDLGIYLNAYVSRNYRQHGRHMTERGVTGGRQHEVQAFGWLVHVAGELLKTDGRIHQITQQQLGRLRLALQQQAGGLLQ